MITELGSRKYQMPSPESQVEPISSKKGTVGNPHAPKEGGSANVPKETPAMVTTELSTWAATLSWPWAKSERGRESSH
jgi:hypothetical protein